jgi:aminoglycoside phosphotransferase (APT) family kinase protein
MNHQWDPQQTVDSSLAIELIQEQFPQLLPIEIRSLGAGWDNTAFLINQELVFRFPRRQIAIPFLEAEWRILPKLAPHLSLPVPVPEWRGAPTSKFTWPFIGYRMLTGITACKAHLSEEERGLLAEPLAHFLSQLHAAPPSLIEGCPIPNDNQGRIDWKVLIPKILKNFADLAELNLLPNRKDLEKKVEGLQGLRSPLTSQVVHGDLYIRHLLLNESNALCGVIDWGDIHLGDAAIDLSIAHSLLPEKAHDLFRKTYGEISEQSWSLALLRSIFSATLIMLFGYHTKDDVLVQEGTRILHLVANKA